MPPTTHVDLGGSGAHRWMQCPGSIRLSRGQIDLPSTYAMEGTTAHAVAERCLRKGLDPDVYLDTQIEGQYVTEEMVEAVRVYVDFVRDLIEHGYECEFEVQFDLAPLSPPGPMRGTADTAAWHPTKRHLVVPDFKYGAGLAVDAWENAQGMMYALGACVQRRRKPQKITVVIVQPRAHHPDGIIRAYEFDWARLVEFKKELFEAARATLAEDAPLRAGEHCQFCLALPICPQQKEHAMVVAQQEFGDIEEHTLPTPETLDHDDLVLILEKMGMVQSWFAAVRAYAQSKLERGEEFPGYKLVPKRATRKWTDEDAVLDYLVTQGVAEDDLFTRKIVSPAQAEKALKALAPRGKKKSVTLPEELVSAESSGYNMVPDHDPRPALAYKAGDEFEND